MTSSRKDWRPQQDKHTQLDKCFCSSMKCTPVLSSEITLVLFVSHLADSNISHTIIKVYLVAIRQLHVSTGLQSSTHPTSAASPEWHQKASSCFSSHQNKTSHYNLHNATDPKCTGEGAPFLQQCYVMDRLLFGFLWFPERWRIHHPSTR